MLDIRSARDLRQFFRYDPDGPPLVTTHRGGARPGFPDNAIETFENTLRHTWSSLEVDPRYTSDGVAVLFHDDTLERTSTRTGLVRDHSYEELRRLRLKDPNGNLTEYRIPTLETALDWAKGKTVLFLQGRRRGRTGQAHPGARCTCLGGRHGVKLRRRPPRLRVRPGDHGAGLPA